MRFRRTEPCEDDLYPDRDGRPFDSDQHRRLLAALLDRLETRYRDNPQTYVSGWLLVYPRKGDPAVRVAPDVFVVFGVPKRSRKHYLLWNEGVSPAAVIELTSDSTRLEDWHDKLTMYRDTLRVPEVFIFDPLRDYLDPPLQGFRLSDGRYQPIPPADGRLPSEQLGVWLEADGDDLRLIDPVTGRRLVGRRGVIRPKAVRELRAEIARLRAEIAALRRERSPTDPDASARRR